MSDPKAPRPTDVPVEAKARDGMDTLFSAPWFDDAAANAPTEEVAPRKQRNPLAYVVAGVVVFVLLPSLLCGAVGVLGGLYYYLAAAGSL